MNGNVCALQRMVMTSQFFDCLVIASPPTRQQQLCKKRKVGLAAHSFQLQE